MPVAAYAASQSPPSKGRTSTDRTVPGCAGGPVAPAGAHVVSEGQRAQMVAPTRVCPEHSSPFLFFQLSFLFNFPSQQPISLFKYYTVFSA